MSKSEYAMPIIIINMGGEMIYILHQRLLAQNVPPAKQRQVLLEVIGAMFDPSFCVGLFQPQMMYTCTSARQIFDRLAHSSLMRLNKSSMDKLFDLMTMSFKHQILNCSHPREFLYVTLLHLQAIRNIVQGHTQTMNLLSETEVKLISLYGPSGPCSGLGPQMLLKQSLLEFLQDKKVRASLFLQHDIQTRDGSFNLSITGPLPFGTLVPGSVRVLDRGRTRQTYRVSADIKSAERTLESIGPWNPEFRFGTNLYSMNSSLLCLESAEADEASYGLIRKSLESFEAGGGGTIGDDSDSSSNARFSALNSQAMAAPKDFSPSKMMDSAAAKAERNLNEALFGRADSKGVKGPVNLASLIPSNHMAASDGAQSGNDGGFIDMDMDILEFDAASDAKTMDSMMAHLDLHTEGDAKNASSSGRGAKATGFLVDSKDAEESDDDLLALMDGL
eukprot:GSChrysophyteH1.ASY1.ANO1.1937.1 assembled CDS